MAISITHAKVSAVANDAAASAAGEVLPSDWNAAHTVTGAAGLADNNSFTGTNTFGSLLTLTKTDGANYTYLGKHDPTVTGTVGTAAGNVANVKFTFAFQPTQWTNDGNYIDNTYHLGFNGVTSQFEAAKPGWGISFEENFAQGAGQAHGFEFHVQGVQSDGISTFRTFSLFQARDDSVAQASFRVDQLEVKNRAGTQRILYRENAGIPICDVNGGTVFSFSTNNVPAFQQKNATGSAYLPLPFINSANVCYVSQATVIEGARPTSGNFPGIFFVLSVTSANSNDVAYGFSGPAVTGNYYARKLVASVSGQLLDLIENSGAGDARQILQTDNGGRAYTSWFDSLNGKIISAGCDAADGGKFKLSVASTIQTSTAFTIDQNLNVICNNAALATTATNGFLYIPSCAGAPTGVPTSYAGRIPIVYDSTNNKLYAYNGAWKSVALA